MKKLTLNTITIPPILPRLTTINQLKIILSIDPGECLSNDLLEKIYNNINDVKTIDIIYEDGGITKIEKIKDNKYSISV